MLTKEILGGNKFVRKSQQSKTIFLKFKVANKRPFVGNDGRTDGHT